MLDGDISGDLVLGNACQQTHVCLFIMVMLNVVRCSFFHEATSITNGRH